MPAVISSGLVGVVGGHFLKVAIEKSVAHGFDREIEKLKSDLKRKETAINDLKASALSGLAARHVELDKHRIRAASNLWAWTIKEKRFHTAAGMVSRLNRSAILEATKEDQVARNKMMQLGEVLWKTSGLDNLPQASESSPDLDRIFLPPRAWVCFDALRHIGIDALAFLGTMKSGAPLSILKDSSETNEKVKIALPHQAQFLDKYPETGAFYCIGELESKIFTEITQFLTANDTHLRAVDDASRILEHVKQYEPGKLPEGVPDKLRVDPPPIDELPS